MVFYPSTLHPPAIMSIGNIFFRPYGATIIQRLKILRLFTFVSLILGRFFWPIWILSAYVMAFSIVGFLHNWTNKMVASSTIGLNGMYGVRPFLNLSESYHREFLIKLNSVIRVIHNNCFPSASSPFIPSFMMMEFAPPAPQLSCNTTCYLGDGKVFSPSMGHIGVNDYANNRYVSAGKILKYVYAFVFVFLAIFLVFGVFFF